MNTGEHVISSTLERENQIRVTLQYSIVKVDEGINVTRDESTIDLKIDLGLNFGRHRRKKIIIILCGVFIYCVTHGSCKLTGFPIPGKITSSFFFSFIRALVTKNEGGLKQNRCVGVLQDRNRKRKKKKRGLRTPHIDSSVTCRREGGGGGEEREWPSSNVIRQYGLHQPTKRVAVG